jgi:hypothetical protein
MQWCAADAIVSAVKFGQRTRHPTGNGLVFAEIIKSGVVVLVRHL